MAEHANRQMKCIACDAVIRRAFACDQIRRDRLLVFCHHCMGKLTKERNWIEITRSGEDSFAGYAPHIINPRTLQPFSLDN